MTRVQLRLFIAPQHAPSRRAAAELETLCARRPGWELEVVELGPNPSCDIALAPTLVRASPGPERRVFGDLSDLTAALERLELAV